MILLIFFLFISCDAMEIPQENRFGLISNDDLRKVIYYADIQNFEEYLAKPTKKEMEKKFLPAATLHLVNKRFCKVFFEVCFKIITSAYQKGGFPFQRYSFASSELKQEICSDYDKANIGPLEQFINYPYHRPFYFAGSDINGGIHFELLDPFYRLTYEDFDKRYRQDFDEKTDNYNFVNLIRLYLPCYRERFEEAGQSFNLWMLLALAMVSNSKTVKRYSDNNYEKPLVSFYQYFYNGPFCKKAKDIFFEALIQNPPSTFISPFENLSRSSLKKKAEEYIRFFNEGDCLVKKAMIELLKKKLKQKAISERGVHFFMTLYTLIFAINNDVDLQASLKGNFMQFFKDNNCLGHLETINQIQTKDFDFWTVYEQLHFLGPDDLLKELLTQYSSSEKVMKKLNRVEVFYANPEALFAKMKGFLDEISFDFNSYEAITQKYLLYHHCISCFDRNIKIKIDNDLLINVGQFEFINGIVFFIAEKAGLQHEDVAIKMNLKNYLNLYRYAFCLEDFEKIEKEVPSPAALIKRLKHMNPLYHFSDGTVLFEIILASSFDTLGLCYDYSNNVEAIFVRKIIAVPSIKNNALKNEKAIKFIKRLLVADEHNRKQFAGNIQKSDFIKKEWLVYCLPYIVIVTDELKNMVRKDTGLIALIDVMCQKFVALGKESYTPEYAIERQKTHEFFQHLLVNSKKNEVKFDAEKIPKAVLNSSASQQPVPNEPKLSLLQWASRNSHFLFKIFIGSVGAIASVAAISCIFKRFYKKLFSIL